MAYRRSLLKIAWLPLRYGRFVVGMAGREALRYRRGVARGAFLLMALGLAAAEPAAAAAASVLFAGGQWAAIDRGRSCEAESRALRLAARGKVQARAGLAFDRGRGRRGELHALLSRAPRPGGTVILTVGGQPFLLVARGQWAWSRGPAQEAAIIAAMRAASGMRIEARDQSGRRFTDRYLLAGAPTAIDAAAAACSR